MEDEGYGEKNFPKATTAKKSGAIKKEIFGDNKEIVILDTGFIAIVFIKTLISACRYDKPFDNNMKASDFGSRRGNCNERISSVSHYNVGFFELWQIYQIPATIQNRYLQWSIK